jgi:hypothetical protein
MKNAQNVAGIHVNTPKTCADEHGETTTGFATTRFVTAKKKKSIEFFFLACRAPHLLQEEDTTP